MTQEKIPTFPMPPSLADFIECEERKEREIQRLKRKREILFNNIRYRLSPEGREMRIKIKIVNYNVFKLAVQVAIGKISPEQASHELQELFKELELTKINNAMGVEDAVQ